MHLHAAQELFLFFQKPPSTSVTQKEGCTKIKYDQRVPLVSKYTSTCIFSLSIGIAKHKNHANKMKNYLT